MIFSRQNDNYIKGAVIGVTCLFLILLLILTTKTKESAVQADLSFGDHGKTVFYLAADSNVDSDPLLASSEFKSRNDIMIVQDFAELKNLNNTLPAVGAIIVHGSRLDELDTEWMQNVYAQGTTIAGINVTIKKLAEIVGDEMVASDPVWTDDWYQEPYFSVLAFKPIGTEAEQELARKEGTNQAFVSHTTENVIDNDFGLFFEIIDQDVTVLGEIE